MRLVKIYDTTLRDGAQAEDISFITADKLKIAKKLDDLGVHYIEGGWPGANPKDDRFFGAMKNTRLNIARLVAFGSTRKKDKTAESDDMIKTLLSAGTDAVMIVGKSWEVHVTEVLNGKVKVVPQVSIFLRGDANGDYGVDVADAVSILGYLFADGSAPSCLDALDANDDGLADIADPITILNTLFTPGTYIAAPYPGMGRDSTPDQFDACIY